MIMVITMTETEVVERIAAQTELEPEDVERVLEAAAESVRGPRDADRGRGWSS